MNTVFVIVDEETLELACERTWGEYDDAEEERLDSDYPENYFVMEMDERDYDTAVKYYRSAFNLEEKS